MKKYPLQLAYSVEQAAQILGIGKTKLYELIGSSEIEAKKYGRRTLIPFKSMKMWLENLPSINGEVDFE